MKKVSDPLDDVYSMALRKRSKSFKSRDVLLAFFYVLMRDHVTPGVVEYIMIQLDKEFLIAKGKPITFTNGWLTKYADDVLGRLKGTIETPSSRADKDRAWLDDSVAVGKPKVITPIKQRKPRKT